ncbi:VPS55 [Malassezia furfur]|nr:VPS55 [Malassezia furfur]
MLAMGELGAVLVEYVSRTHTAVAFVLAPAPNALFGGLAGADSFSDFNNAYIDFGNFLTGALVTTGIAVPVLLAHTGIITIAAAGMSLAGGLLIYGTSAYSTLRS